MGCEEWCTVYTVNVYCALFTRICLPARTSCCSRPRSRTSPTGAFGSRSLGQRRTQTGQHMGQGSQRSRTVVNASTVLGWSCVSFHHVVSRWLIAHHGPSRSAPASWYTSLWAVGRPPRPPPRHRLARLVGCINSFSAQVHSCSLCSRWQSLPWTNGYSGP